MKKRKVKVDVLTQGFNKYRHGVRFSNGVAIAEFTEPQINDFIAWGYKVEELEKQEAPKPKKVQKKTEK
jgi:hypothetical protein